MFYKRLTKAIEKSGKSANCVERELGYSRNALHNYKNGTESSGTRLIELAKYFNIFLDYLIGKNDDSKRLNITTFFNRLSEEQKIYMFKISQAWACNKISK